MNIFMLIFSPNIQQGLTSRKTNEPTNQPTNQLASGDVGFLNEIKNSILNIDF